jgi:hypothetical protein
MMKGVPNFYPRSSGIVVTGIFRYTAEMCDCEYCGYYGGKKKGCLVPKCVCLEERISVGIASVKEIMTETMSEIKHGGFLRRLRRYIKESEAIHSIENGSEFYITVYGSIAQSESENISANVKWGKEQSAREGNVSFHYKNFLGYRKGGSNRRFGYGDRY